MLGFADHWYRASVWRQKEEGRDRTPGCTLKIRIANLKFHISKFIFKSSVAALQIHLLVSPGCLGPTLATTSWKPIDSTGIIGESRFVQANLNAIWSLSSRTLNRGEIKNDQNVDMFCGLRSAGVRDIFERRR